MANARLRAMVACAVLMGCLLGGASARAAITGISDQNLASWGTGAHNTFNGLTTVQQLRFNTPWNAADPANTIAHSRLVAWMSAAQATGKRILISFDHAQGCDQSHPGCPPPPVTTYIEFVQAFRQQYPNVTEFTAWNEPNHHVTGTDMVDSNPANNPTLAASYWNALHQECQRPSSTGLTCTVAAGDFLDGSGTGTGTYMDTYKGALSASPTVWAVHPYTAVDTGSFTALNSNFVSKTGIASIWFSEVGAYYCHGQTVLGVDSQAEDATHLNSLMASTPRLKRTYYYFLAGPNGTTVTCPASDGFDTALLGAGDQPRPAFSILFP